MNETLYKTAGHTLAAAWQSCDGKDVKITIIDADTKRAVTCAGIIQMLAPCIEVTVFKSPEQKDDLSGKANQK